MFTSEVNRWVSPGEIKRKLKGGGKNPAESSTVRMRGVGLVFHARGAVGKTTFGHVDDERWRGIGRQGSALDGSKHL